MDLFLKKIKIRGCFDNAYYFTKEEIINKTRVGGYDT